MTFVILQLSIFGRWSHFTLYFHSAHSSKTGDVLSSCYHYFCNHSTDNKTVRQCLTVTADGQTRVLSGMTINQAYSLGVHCVVITAIKADSKTKPNIGDSDMYDTKVSFYQQKSQMWSVRDSSKRSGPEGYQRVGK